MRLTREDFERAGDALVAASDRCGDAWAWAAARGNSRAFLVKRGVRRCGDLSARDEDIEVVAFAEDDDDPAVAAAEQPVELVVEDDPAATTRSATQAPEPSFWDYHIVFSPAFEVPALYFAASRADGSPLPSGEVMQALHPAICSFRAGIFPAVSMDVRCHPASPGHRSRLNTWQDHPFLGIPFMLLHPCGTADLLDASGSQPPLDRLLAAWLSLQGPYVGVQVPVALASL